MSDKAMELTGSPARPHKNNAVHFSPRWYGAYRGKTVGRVVGHEKSISGVVLPSFAGPELEAGEGEDDEKLDPGHRAGVTHFEVVEGVVIKVHRVEVGASRRAALGEDERRGEDLECADDSHDEVEEDNGRNRGERDMPDFSHRRCAINAGGFIEFAGNVLQCRGEIDDETVFPTPQKLMRTSEGIDQRTSVSQPGGLLMPMARRPTLIKPSLALKSQSQSIAEATVGTSEGRKMSVR